MTQAIEDIAAERRRQIDAEGWDRDHDDRHGDGSLAQAAAAYAYAAKWPGRNPGRLWPWDAKWWKPGTARRMLVKAGALIVAEIERLDRACGMCDGTGYKDHAGLAMDPCDHRHRILLVNQHGTTVGVEYVYSADLYRREVHVDEHGTVWTQPTAWAYMQVCKTLERVRYGEPAGEDLRDKISELINPIHWETWIAALFCNDPDGWPTDDEQELIKRRVDDIAVGEHWSAHGGPIVDQVVKLIEDIRAGRSPASPQEVSLTEIHPAPTEFNPEQLAQDNILRYFHYAHLPEKLQAASKPFCDLARHIVETLPRNPERTVALRKLLEAKDAGVRANVE